MLKKASAGILTLVCTKTGQEISAGALHSPADLERLRDAKLMLRRKLCRQAHMFHFADARLARAAKSKPARFK